MRIPVNPGESETSAPLVLVMGLGITAPAGRGRVERYRTILNPELVSIDPPCV